MGTSYHGGNYLLADLLSQNANLGNNALPGQPRNLIMKKTAHHATFSKSPFAYLDTASTSYVTFATLTAVPASSYIACQGTSTAEGNGGYVRLSCGSVASAAITTSSGTVAWTIPKIQNTNGIATDCNLQAKSANGNICGNQLTVFFQAPYTNNAATVLNVQIDTLYFYVFGASQSILGYAGDDTETDITTVALGTNVNGITCSAYNGAILYDFDGGYIGYQ